MLPAGYLMERLAATLAFIGIDICSRAVASQSVPLAICFDRTDRQAESLGNGGIAVIFTAHFFYF